MILSGPSLAVTNTTIVAVSTLKPGYFDACSGPFYIIQRKVGETDTVLRPPFQDLFDAFLLMDNTVAAYFKSRRLTLDRTEFHSVDPDYNPFKNGDLVGYEELVDHFMDAHNATTFAAIKADIDWEMLSVQVMDLEQSCWF
jgi:hypothetical protein